MTSAGEVLAKSWHETIQNPVLLVPKVFALLVSTVLFTLFLLFSGILQAIITAQTAEELLAVFMAVPTMPLFWAYIVIEFIVHSYFAGMSFGMYRDITLQQHPTLRTGAGYGRAYLARLLLLSFIWFLLIGVPVALVLGALLLPLSNLLAKFALVAFLMLLLFLWLLLVSFHLFFLHTVLFFEKKDTWQTLKLSALFGRRNLLHTLTTWFVVIGISAGMGIVRQSVESTSSIAVFGLIAVILLIPLEMLVGVWEHLFVFNQYLEKRPRGSGATSGH